MADNAGKKAESRKSDIVEGSFDTLTGLAYRSFKTIIFCSTISNDRRAL